MAKSNKFLTIFIPTFNSAQYLKETLNCLVKQNDKNFCVFIIDDNSKDLTKKIIDKFDNILDISFIRKKNFIGPGAAASINYAFRNLETPYWALIDSDAFIAPNWVETMLRLLLKKKLTGAPILATEKAGRVAYLIGLDIEYRYKKIQNKWLRHLSTCNIAGRKEIINDINLNEKLKYAYDHELSFLFKNRNIRYFFTNETYCYHLNKSGIWNYFLQQYKIAKYHTILSKMMPKEALNGDEISPSYFVLQPVLLILLFFLIAFAPLYSIIPLAGYLLINIDYLKYCFIKKPILALEAFFLTIIKNLAWICGLPMGIISRI